MLPKFDYYAPDSLRESLELRDKLGNDTRVLAGGTDLLVNMRARVERPKHLIDIKHVDELRELSYSDEEGLTIGACVTLNKLIHDKQVAKNYPILTEAASTIADFQIRNRATIVGNICNASPAADMAPALLVLDAAVNIATGKTNRTVPIQEFFTGVKKTVLGQKEIVTSINIPCPPKSSRGGYLKARRSLGEDVAIVGVGGLLIHNGGATPELRVAYASVAPTPVRAYEAEKVFGSKISLDDAMKKAMPIIMKTVSPISDVRGGKEYRANLVGVLTSRLAHRLWEAS